MVADGIRQIGDGLLEVAEERLKALLVSGVDINEVYDVEQTPFARGKFAAVRRAVHKKTGVHYAAKFLRRRRRAQCTVREIGHEIAVLMLCADSKHIVKLNAVHESKSETALILELATGGELQAILDEDGSLTELQAQTCMREILAALQYLHSKRIAHLDIKPQNILLCGDTVEDGLKLCDFGISRLVAEVGEVREILGTPDYVAPEVLQYEPLSLATDIWSIGVLAYVLLTGCSPFGGDTKQETFLNISQCTLNFPEDLFEGVSDEAMDFIRSALRIKPKERMTATECLNHQWLRRDPVAVRLDVSPIHSISLNLVPNLDETAHDIHLHCNTKSLKASSPSSSSSSSCSTSTGPNSCSSDETSDAIEPTTDHTTTATTHVYISLTPAQSSSTTCHASAKPSPAITPTPSTPQTPKDTIYFKCNNKENVSCNVKYFGLKFKPSDVSLNSHLSTQSSSPKVHTPPPVIHHFPDAPTTPKVSRKSSPDSPPSVKALVKKFQLAAPDNHHHTTDTHVTHTSRRAEFPAECSPSTNNTTSSGRTSLDSNVEVTATTSLCRSHNATSTTISSSPSLAVIRKPLSVEQGIIC